jgi:hypothetical protein
MTVWELTLAKTPQVKNRCTPAEEEDFDEDGFGEI